MFVLTTNCCFECL